MGARLLALLALTACPCGPPDPDDSTPPEADADSDADSDADADADSDADTDTGPHDWSHLDPFVAPDVWVEPDLPPPGGTATVFYRGALAGAERLVLHHGFNGWHAVQGLDDLVEVDKCWQRDTEMVRGKDGTFSATITLPTDGRALHFAVHDPVADVWDNNGGLDWGWGFSFPYLGPWLGWDAAARPEDGIVVHFETSLPCLGVVEYGPTEDLGLAVAGSTFGTMHHVALTGLEQDTDYGFRLWDAAGNASRVFHFRTARASADSLGFVVLSDMQDAGGTEVWDDVAAEVLASHADAAFALIAGDMPAEDAPGAWWTFFDRGRALFESLPILTVPGNHDTPGVQSSTDLTHYLRYFPASGEPFWSFEYGAVHVLGLCSEDPPALAPGGEQYRFAEEDLAALWDGGVRTPDWVVAAWHTPPYDVGSRHASEQYAFRDVTGLFDGQVDIAFSGHEHLYQRFLPLRYEAWVAPSSAYGIGPEDGVAYVVTPPAGTFSHDEILAADHPDAAVLDLLAFPEIGGSTHVASENGFLTVDLTPTRLTLRSWGMGTINNPVPAWERDTLVVAR